MTTFSARAAYSQVFIAGDPHVSYQAPSVLRLSDGDVIVGLNGKAIGNSNSLRDGDISGQRLDPSSGNTPSGSRVGTAFELNDQSESHQQTRSNLVELDDGTYLSAYTTMPPHQGGYSYYKGFGDAEAVRLNSSDEIFGDEIEPGETSGFEGESELMGGMYRSAYAAALDGQFAIAYQAAGDIKLRFYTYDSTSMTAGTTVTVDSGDFTYENPATTFNVWTGLHVPQVHGLDDGHLAVSWLENNGWTITPAGSVQVRLYNDDGTVLSDEVTVSNGYTSAFSTDVLLDGRSVFTWHRDITPPSTTEIYQTVLGAGGEIVTFSQQVNTQTNGDQSFSRVSALDNGGWIITWESDGESYVQNGVTYNDPNQIKAQLYRADGSADGGEFVVGSMSQVTDIAATPTGIDGGFAVFWVSGNGNPNVNIDGPVVGQYWTANASAQALTGTGGDDVIYAEWGNDTLSGLAGNDYLFGDGGDDLIFGGDGNDTLWGAAGDDTLSGGAGHDLFVLVDGAYSIDGGSGHDVIEFTGAGADMVVDLATQSFSGGDLDDDTITGIEGITTGAGADTITGTSEANLLDGGLGNDSIDGAGGGDTLSGGGGADVLKGGDGDDLLVGGAGADTLSGGAGFDTVDYSANEAGVTVDLSAGSATGDAVTGDLLSGIEAVIATASADTLSGSSAANALSGGFGDDSLLGGDGADTLYGAGDNDTLLGGNGADLLSGGAGRDLLFGGAGDDTLYGGEGVDTIAGTAADFDGDLLADFSAAEDLLHLTDVAPSQTVTVSQDGGTTTVTVYEADGATVASTFDVDGLYYTASLSGDGSGGSWLTFNTPIVGTSGADTLTGTAVVDTMSGGSGDDLLLGLGHGDHLSGGQGSDTLSGGDGDDELFGGKGDDVLVGGQGADTLNGGIDSYTLGEPSTALAMGKGDLSTWTEKGASVTYNASLDAYEWTATTANSASHYIETTTLGMTTGVRQTVSVVIKAGAMDEFLFQAITTTNNADHHHNIIFDLTDGSAAPMSNVPDDTGVLYDSNDLGNGWYQIWVSAGAGVTDGDLWITLRGSVNGAPTFAGGGSTDYYIRDLQIEQGVSEPTPISATPNPDGDVVSYAGSSAAVAIDLATGIVSGGDAEGDVLINVHGVIGSDHADTLSGTTAGNLFSGGDGADILAGGDGSDTFIGTIGEFSGDTLSDFSFNEDTIHLTDVGTDRIVDLSQNVDTTTVTVYEADGVTVAGTFTLDGLHFRSGLTSDGSGGSYLAIDMPLVGTSGGDTIIGTAADDIMSGVAGDDLLSGGSGSDTLSGGEGTDTLVGGAGADVIDGGADSYSLGANSTALAMGKGDLTTWTEVAASVNYNATLDAYEWSASTANTLHRIDTTTVGMTTGARQTFSVVMKAGNLDEFLIQVITTPSNADHHHNILFDLTDGSSVAGSTVPTDTGVLHGSNDLGDGWYQLWVSAGPGVTDGDLWVTLTGVENGSGYFAGSGAGVDAYIRDIQIEQGVSEPTPIVLLPDPDGDVISYEGSTAAVDVDLAAGTASGGDAEGDVFTNVHGIIGSDHADTLSGSSSNNLISGGAGADTIAGGDGADTLVGGTGADVLTGGSGADVFVIAGGDGDDVIIDFVSGVDQIDIAGSFVDQAALEAAATDVGSDVEVTIGTGQIVTLIGLQTSELSYTYFI